MTSTRPPVYNGRYELQSQVARGGTAQVYLARDIILSRPVALKVLFPELSTDPTFVERFRREAQAAASLSHPNIVPVYDWGESENTYFIVMEYVDGEPLSSIVHTQAPLAPGNAAQIAVDIAKALSYAHRRGVVHRDVKPGNVLITSDGQVKVTDFGIARAIGGADDQVTQTGLVMGTATYFSPEQAQGLDVDGRSDIYSLGVVLYEMLTGRPPFSGDTPVSIAYQHVQETAPRPRSLNPEIPPALEAIVMQAMAKLPAERYQSADELRADLDRFLRNQTVLAAPPSEFAGAPATEVLGRATAAYGMDTTAVPTAAAYRAPKVRTTTPYWIGAAVLLVIAIVIVGIIGGRSLGYFGGSKFVQIPDVRTYSPTAAQSALRSKGFDPIIEHHVQGNLSNQNTVTAENPGFPTSAKSGTKIYLTVAGAVPTATIPSVINTPKAQAVSALKAAGFDVKLKNVAPANATQTQNEVVKQNPSANSVKPKGSTVTLSVVSTKNVAIPSVANDTEIQAAAALSKAGFNNVTTTQQFSSTVPSGSVISSTPASGTSVAQTTAISLSISEGAGVTVPSLLGYPASQAISMLEGLGLVPDQGAVYPTGVPGDVGNVAWQSIAQGTQVTPGTKVKFRVGYANSTITTTTTTTTTTLPLGNTGTTTTLPPGVP